jgi:hypothetical protein
MYPILKMAIRRKPFNHADGSPERKPDLNKLIRMRCNHIYYYCPVTEESVIELIIKVHECKDLEIRRLESEIKGSDGEDEEEAKRAATTRAARAALCKCQLSEKCARGNYRSGWRLWSNL